MKHPIRFYYLILVFVGFFLDHNYKTGGVYADNLPDLNLDKELKNGNFLIGIKQYLGSNKNNLIKKQSLLFQTSDQFFSVKSSNGVSHKSKSVKINFKTVPLQNPFVKERLVSKPFASFESAKKESLFLKSKGFDPIIAMPDSWVLWLPKGLKDQAPRNFKLKKMLIKDKIVPYLSNEYTYQKLDGLISISSNEDIKINDISYGKNFYLTKDAYGSWTLIQRISFNQYLNGVLPHEIGINSPMEALKAQAVIARTWALYNSDRFKVDKFHLCVTTQCQVYKPSSSNKKISKAIKDTNNLVLAYENKPINAFYHASNGGISAKASESWQIQDYPYLVSKKDINKKLNQNHKFSIKSQDDLKTFMKINKTNFFGHNHYLFRWKKKVSVDKIQDSLLNHNLINKKREIRSLNVLNRGDSGRVTKLEIEFSSSKEPIILLKDDIRRYLKFLPSNLFLIDKLNDNFWVFTGGGFGHGVGLSQSGAIEMAKLGYNYRKILKHYYKDTKIQRINDLYEK